MRIAVLTDIHYSSIEKKTCGARETGIADILFRRAIERLNRLVRPDLTIIAGDLVNRGDLEYGHHDMLVIAECLKRLHSPFIVIPGNHDAPAEEFYKYFPQPERIVDFGGLRFVINPSDKECPGYNAWRAQNDIDLIAEARRGFAGHIITLQHTPCYPPGTADCLYNYTNSAEINAAEAANGVLLSISGHHHEGFKPYRAVNGVTYFAAPALCEEPFNISYVDIDVITGKMQWYTNALRMDKRLNLTDTHIHTHFAYCNENISLKKTQYLADIFGLKSFMLTEHSGHLLCARNQYHAAQYQQTDFQTENWRGNQYFKEMLSGNMPPERIGLEADIRFDGTWLAHPRDLQRAGIIIGAIHEMRPLALKEKLTSQKLKEYFLLHCQAILKNGCLSLAHPFRIFRRAGIEIPAGCFEPLVKMLKESGTAVEINFHTNEPPIEFFKMAINAGVRITLGSDAHNLYEIGDFALHLDFLKKCGINTNYEDVLLEVQ